MSGAHLGVHKFHAKSFNSVNQINSHLSATGMLESNKIVNGIPFQEIYIDCIGPMLGA
ncbi:Retrotransposable element Tf2 protein type 1 [Aphis craccivora]|uniref:Retrotransposable element Tf2 protein type 1 n=1 Tax=Aphis craccivora TaxID=307492 RepID=A0A6G0Y7Z0_APHCR|nr:Retrotransposable element Tf2 protein type 1 [Aphis craccivora]